ncbi:MAG: CAF17-like 4Fe-4S cluster assembly/insertion protein YgfZ [Planctomycetota bacterium]
MTLLTTRHRAAGARFAGDGDEAPLLTFGDVPAEYAAGTDGCALFDASDRGALRMGGDDRIDFCHRILSNTIHGLEPGQGNRQLLLSPKGKILADFELVVLEEALCFSTLPGHVPALAQGLDMFLFADAVELEDTSASSAPIELVGPRAADVVARLTGIATGDDALRSYHVAIGAFEGSTAVITRVPVAGSLGWRVDAGPDALPALWDAAVAAGATPAGLVAHDCLRVEAVAPLFGVDIDDQVYPQEARLEEAFALDKGCYIGQEVVAKIDTYGGLNKCLVPLAISHDDPVARGTKLIAHDPERDTERELGVVTSWAYSFVRDTGLVLAYVKRRHQAVGNEFRLGGADGTATVVEAPVRPGARALTGAFEAAS